MGECAHTLSTLATNREVNAACKACRLAYKENRQLRLAAECARTGKERIT